MRESEPARSVSRIALTSVAFLGLVGLMSACAPTTGSGEDADDGVTIRLMSDFVVPWVPQIPWLYAIEKGWYKEAGLNVEYLIPQGGTSPANLAGVGQVDMAIVYTSDLITASENDLDLKALMQVGEKLPGGVCALEGSGITNPQDLEGKTVGVINNPHSLSNWNRFLELNDVDASNITMVDAGDDPTPLLIAGSIDAAGDAAEVQECLQASIATGKEHLTMAFTDDYGFPETYFLEIAANGAWLDTHQDAARSFVEVTQRAIAYCERNGDECLEVYIASDPQNVDPEVATRGYDLLRQNYWCDGTASCWNPDKPIGWIDPDIWLAEAQFRKDNDLISGDPKDTLAVLTDNSFLSDEYMPQSE